MLRSAALGINYLHSLDPTIIHRDIKPSNLLVDEPLLVQHLDTDGDDRIAFDDFMVRTHTLHTCAALVAQLSN